MKSTLAAIVVLMLFGWAGAAAATAAAEEAKFYPPDGWAVMKQPDGSVAVQPPGVPAGNTCAVLIMPDVPEGEVNFVHAMGWKLLTAEVKVTRGGDVRAARTMAGFDMRSTTAAVDPPDAAETYMHLFSVQAGPKVRRALFVGDDQASFDKHLPAVKAMLDEVGVDPAVAKQKREATKGRPTNFEGVFYRGSVDFDPTGQPGERYLRVDFLCLMPDGRAYNGRPAGGPAASFERDADDLRSPSYGVYTIKGDAVVITWNYDRTLNRQHTQKLKRRADGKLEDAAGGEVFHALPACDGLKLDGAYAITWGDDTKTRIQFTKDGRFTEQGLKTCANLEDFQNPDLPKLPERGGAGTYSIGRNTLEVKYDNGGPSRRLFFFTPDDPSDPARVRRISIANYPLEREP